MLCFRLGNKNVVISSEVCGLVLGIILFQGFQYLLHKRKNNQNDAGEKEKKMRRIVNVALCNTRGGDLYLDKAVESCVNGPGYYELVGFLFSEELKKFLGCQSDKPVMVVTLGVLRALEIYVFRNKSALIPWFPIPQLFRKEKVILQAFAWFLMLMTLNAIVVTPAVIKNFQMVAFAITILIRPGYTFKTITKLPTIVPTLQYIERPLLQSQRQFLPKSRQQQRVILKIGDGGQLLEMTSEKVLQNQLIEIRSRDRTFKFDGDKSKLVSISDSEANKILSPNKEGSESKSVIDVRNDLKNVVKEIKTRQKYEPLSQRTKTLKDIENRVPKGDFIEAEVFERKVEERCKSQPSHFLKIEDK